MSRVRAKQASSEPSRRRRLPRILLGILITGVLLVTASTLIGGCLSAPTYSGPVTPHFDGERFRNELEVPKKSLLDILRWQWKRDPPKWTKRAGEPGAPPPERVEEPGVVRVTFINHSTTLLQLDGLNILTDPVYSKRASPVSWAGPRRHRQPGIRFVDLPRIDAVIISHNHYDHLDIPTLQRLAEQHAPLFLVPLGNRALLREHGIGSKELDWWQATQLGDVKLTFVPARHWSGRGFGDRYNSLWGGWVIEGSIKPIYFAGDTGWGPHFEQLRRRFGPVQLAMLPIGAYKPRWFMKAAHLSPAEAVKAHLTLGARHSVAIHFGTFQLSDEAQDDPPAELKNAVKKSARMMSNSAFRALDHGEAWVVRQAGQRR